MNQASGAGSIAQPVNQQYSSLPLCYGRPPSPYQRKDKRKRKQPYHFRHLCNLSVYVPGFPCGWDFIFLYPSTAGVLVKIRARFGTSVHFGEHFRWRLKHREENGLEDCIRTMNAALYHHNSAQWGYIGSGTKWHHEILGMIPCAESIAAKDVDLQSIAIPLSYSCPFFMWSGQQSG